MPQHFIGGIIKEYREKNDISQKKLCKGLCSISTLCKIENGDQNPSSYMLLEALVQRVGAPLSMIEIPLTSTEFERVQILNKIESLVAHKDYEFKDLLNKYESLTPPMNLFEQQAYARTIAIYNIHHNKISREEEYEDYVKALQLTCPEYTLSSDISMEIFSTQEINLILYSGMSLFWNKQLTEAITVLSKLKGYFDIHDIDADIRKKIYPILADYLANAYGMTDDYINALKVSNDGIEECKQESSIFVLPDLLYAKGFTLVLMKRKTQEMHIIKQALALLKIMKRQDAIKILKEDIITSFGQDFWNKL